MLYVSLDCNFGANEQRAAFRSQASNQCQGVDAKKATLPEESVANGSLTGF